MKKKGSKIASFLNEKRFGQNIKRIKGKNKEHHLLSKYQVNLLSLKHFSDFEAWKDKMT